jgi:hypothetical protein
MAQFVVLKGVIMHDYMTTYTKKHFTVLEPRMEDIDIIDIAHALSMLTRANGHFSQFYSVGQHSICCALESIERDYSPAVSLACLLHDASEAYMCDVIRPIKKELPQYLAAEEVLQNMIMDKFLKEPLDASEEKLVTAIDDAMFYQEFKCFMNEEPDVADHELLTHPAFAFRPFSDTEEEFLMYFYKLSALL